MPTYEYVCRACGHTFDIVQKMSEDTLTVCPACGGELRKVFAAPSISFKGSGFYATDHGKKSKPSSSDKSEKKDGGSKDSGSETKKTDTKSDSGSSSASSESTGKKEGSTS